MKTIKLEHRGKKGHRDFTVITVDMDTHALAWDHITALSSEAAMDQASKRRGGWQAVVVFDGAIVPRRMLTLDGL